MFVLAGSSSHHYFSVERAPALAISRNKQRSTPCTPSEVYVSGLQASRPGTSQRALALSSSYVPRLHWTQDADEARTIPQAQLLAQYLMSPSLSLHRHPPSQPSPPSRRCRSRAASRALTRPPFSRARRRCHLTLSEFENIHAFSVTTHLPNQARPCPLDGSMLRRDESFRFRLTSMRRNARPDGEA